MHVQLNLEMCIPVPKCLLTFRVHFGLTGILGMLQTALPQLLSIFIPSPEITFQLVSQCFCVHSQSSHSQKDPEEWMARTLDEFIRWYLGSCLVLNSQEVSKTTIFSVRLIEEGIRSPHTITFETPPNTRVLPSTLPSWPYHEDLKANRKSFTMYSLNYYQEPENQILISQEKICSYKA